MTKPTAKKQEAIKPNIVTTKDKAKIIHLTPKQNELFAVLFGEAGEVVAEVAKIVRHGMDNDYLRSRNLPSNIVKCEKEVGDFLAGVELLIKEGLFNYDEILKYKKEKLLTIHEWLHCQD